MNWKASSGAITCQRNHVTWIHLKPAGSWSCRSRSIVHTSGDRPGAALATLRTRSIEAYSNCRRLGAAGFCFMVYLLPIEQACAHYRATRCMAFSHYAVGKCDVKHNLSALKSSHHVKP